MSAISYRPRLGPELEYIGTLASVASHRLEVVQFDAWIADTYRPDAPVLIGRNGRPRNPITLPGYGKGKAPLNKGKRYPPEPLTGTEALALLAAIDPTTKAGVRNRALIALLWRTGLRVSEALDLRPHHVDFAGKRVKVMNGKGSKTRTVGIDFGGLLAVQSWLIERQIILNEVPARHATAPLFCTIQMPARGGRMHDAYVRQAMHKYGALAGIPKRVHPHGLRHTLACDLIRERFGIADVQAQLGHSHISTTSLYLRGMGADEVFEKVALREWPGGAS